MNWASTHDNLYLVFIFHGHRRWLEITPNHWNSWLVLEWIGINLWCHSLKRELICNAACGVFWKLVVTSSVVSPVQSWLHLPCSLSQHTWGYWLFKTWLRASGGLGEKGSAISCSFRSSVFCLKWRGLQIKDRKFFSMGLEFLMIEMIGLWLKISGWPDGTSKGIWVDLR